MSLRQLLFESEKYTVSFYISIAVPHFLESQSLIQDTTQVLAYRISDDGVSVICTSTRILVHLKNVDNCFRVADFGMDLTNMMERKGNVYPYVKSAGLGYGYGHRKTDEFDGVCSQLAPNCGDWWSHLETVNEYEGPAINRKATEFRRTMER